jgi:hypothetical protein
VLFCGIVRCCFVGLLGVVLWDCYVLFCGIDFYNVEFTDVAGARIF